MYTVFKLKEKPVENGGYITDSPEFLEFLHKILKELIHSVPQMLRDRQCKKFTNEELNCSVYFHIYDTKSILVDPTHGIAMQFPIFHIEVQQYKAEEIRRECKRYFISLWAHLHEYTVVRPHKDVQYTDTSQFHVVVRHKEIFGYLAEQLKLLYNLDELKIFTEY